MATLITTVLLFAVLPIYLIWRIWKKDNWGKRKKWLATAMVSAASIFIINIGDYVDFSDSGDDFDTIAVGENFSTIDEIEDFKKSENSGGKESNKENDSEDEYATVRLVIDGDTIELDDGRRVRYIGIDTPEMGHDGHEEECFAIEATNENKKMVLGKEVILEKDVSETDKYGRLLRYAYVGPILINEYLIDKGLARTVHIKPDVSYYEEFKMVEDEAREEKRGMWADGICGK